MLFSSSAPIPTAEPSVATEPKPSLEEERIAILTRVQDVATAEWNALLAEAAAEMEAQKQEILEQARKDGERYLEERMTRAREAAEVQAVAILQQAQKRKDQLLTEAATEAALLREQAGRDAESTLENARATASRLLTSAAEESLRQSRQRSHAAYLQHRTEQERLTEDLHGVMQTLTQLHTDVRAIESSVTEAHTRRIYTQLSELYFLMWDSRRSLSERSDAAANPDVQTTCRNLELFMSILSEILADHGIRTVCTETGAPFDGKYHRPHNTLAFDPGTATVSRSLRCGFAWDSTVLEKEWVDLSINKEVF